MKKPDRFERMAVNLPVRGYGSCAVGDVARLLRKEHAWIRRMVKEHTVPRNRFANRDYENGFFDCAVHIMMLLTQRRK